MGIKKEEEFYQDCENNFCNRKTFINRTCYKESKRKECYKKYYHAENKKQLDFENKISKLEFDNDPKYLEYRKQIWIDDCGFFDGESLRIDWKEWCKIWNILTDQEKRYFEQRYEKDLWYRQYLDVAHIHEKSRYPEQKYDLNNSVVIARYFHNLLDQYRHPVTQEKINSYQREAWLRVAKATPLKNKVDRGQ